MVVEYRRAGWALLCCMALVCAATVLRAAPFTRANANADGSVNITDAISTLGFLFLGDPQALGCMDAADSNDDGQVNISDPINTLTVLFVGGASIPAPGPNTCGLDPTLDALSCDVFPPCGPLPPPSVHQVAPRSPTSAETVTIDGTTIPGAAISIAGGAAVTAEAADAEGRFSLTVPLRVNRLNRLFVTASLPPRGTSAPTAVEITQDAQAPSLFIDGPEKPKTEDTILTFYEEITVYGRVSDILSGFMGLQVTVAGERASVAEGIGTNGTFERRDVPLVMGDNEISVSARDRAGNITTKTILIRRTEVPLGPILIPDPDESGNNQGGMVGAELREPIRVQVLQNGVPFAGKIVTFHVTRSDGRLSAVQGTPKEDGSLTLQARSDTNGLAEAFWTLGTDAGCGNNRVTATSTSVAGSVVFCASGAAAPPDRILIGSGNNQRVETGAPAPEALRAWVSDGCNGAREVPVTFTVVRGDGTVNGGPSATVLTSKTGHAQVSFTLGSQPGNNVVEATFPGNPGLPATFAIYGVERVEDAPTTFTGIVLDNAGQPIQGASCLLYSQGLFIDIPSDIDGQFSFNLPAEEAGLAYLDIDGSTATHVGGAEGYDVPEDSFPTLYYDLIITPNAANSLPAPVKLPRLNPRSAYTYDGTQNVELKVEGVEGLSMLVKAGSMTRRDGSKPSKDDAETISLNQVHHDDIPMPMPDGASPPFAWTLQPAGATFDPPIEVTYPNMSGLPAGSLAYFLSFNHDTSRFEIVATGRVRDDGDEIISDPMAGISLAGWGCSCPPYAQPSVCEDECDDTSDEVRTFSKIDNLLSSASSDLTKAASLAAPILTVAVAEAITIQASITGLLHACRHCEEEEVNVDCIVAANVGFLLAATATTVSGISDITIPASRGLITIAETLLHSASADFEEAKSCIASFLPMCNPLDRLSSLLARIDWLLEQLVISNTLLIAAKSALDDLQILVDAVASAVRSALEALGRGEGQTCSQIEAHFIGTLGVFDVTLQGAANSARALQEQLVTGMEMSHAIARLASGTSCTVSVSGLHAVPAGDGSFRIANIPSGPSILRAEAICHDGADGLIYGYSEHFQLQPGQVYGIDDMTMTNVPPPATEHLRLSIDKPLISLGQPTAQMLAIATLKDDTLLNVTPRSAWTTYRVSNPKLIAVDDQGVVTATGNGSGRAFITATNEGATAVTSILVLSNDPLTTVEGRLQFENGAPAIGAGVFISRGPNNPIITDPEGRFQVAGVPATLGHIYATSQYQSQTGRLVGTSEAVQPITQGITDVGIIILRAPRLNDTIPVFSVEGDPGSEKTTIRAFDSLRSLLFTKEVEVARPWAVARDLTGDYWASTGDTLVRFRIQGEDVLVLQREQFDGTDLRDLAIAPDGHVWVCDQARNKVMHFNPAGTFVEEFAAPYEQTHGATIGPSAESSLGYFVWYASYRNMGTPFGALMRIDPATGEQSSGQVVPPPQFTQGLRLFCGPAVGPDGRAWLPAAMGGSNARDALFCFESSVVRCATPLSIVNVSGTDMNHGVLLPDGRLWCCAGDGSGTPGHCPAYLFEFDGDGTFLRNIDLNDDAPCRNIRPEGMFVDGGGQVWVSLSTGSSMYAIPRGAQEGEFIQVGKNPVNRGDPTGYLQAFIVHPNLDFDGDGTANRQELQSGRNPFVGDE